VTRVLERTEGFRQLLGNILTVNAALVAQRQNDKLTRLSEAGYDQNEQVKRISSWAAILFAPTVIASIYGMNFTNIPELEWQLGYPFTILLMLLLVWVPETLRTAHYPAQQFRDIRYVSFSATGGSCRARSNGEAAGQRL
jgi:Mg2+ and Co2+ transporter CorA